MAPKYPVTKYQYVVTAEGPRLMPAEEPYNKDEESPAEYNSGGYLAVKVGDVFANRYRVIRKLGWGHFSTVWLVKDSRTRRHSALKVVKSANRYAETARDEIKLLSRVSKVSPDHPGRNHIVSFLDSFAHRVNPDTEHICIVFEPLGETLLGLIERNKKKGVPRSLVKVIARQVLLGLEYLHDECDLVHTDIKPENILISIPDIEAHIHNELSVSPSPTCRRVGVPQPSKTKSGMSIPPNPNKPRKQVQIFESQPLSSPGKSLGKRNVGPVASMSMHVPPPVTAAVKPSPKPVNVAQMHVTRTGNCLSGTVGSLSSAAGKAKLLAASAAIAEANAQKQAAEAAAAAVKDTTAAPATVIDSPTSSSSSSSVSSALAAIATPVSTSIVNTPPTSLSYSLGHAMMEFIGTGTGKIVHATEASVASTVNPKKAKATTDLETQLSSTISLSWKATTEAISNSWKERISNSFASNKSHSSPKTKQPRHFHPRSQSGISNPGFWKDPGTAAPAPAILVSAVVSAGGQQDDFSKFSAVEPTNTLSPSHASTFASTVVRPSPRSTTPFIAKSSSLIHTVSGLINSSLFSSNASSSNASGDDASRDTNTTNQLSLLTKTAPPDPVSTPSASERSGADVTPVQKSTDKVTQPDVGAAASPSSHHTVQSSAASVVTVPYTSVTPTTSFSAPPPPPSTPVAVSLDPAVRPSSAATATQGTASPGKASQPMSIQGPMLPPQTTPEEPVAPPSISIKIADLGNATPSKKHYTEEIQTRQYRAPEAILGRRDWDGRADIWSVACVIFELLTAEYLFEPHSQAEVFQKDDDHMAQIIELLGDFPMDVKMGGTRSREMFDNSGGLRYIRNLKPWPLDRVMVEKYLFSEEDSAKLCSFLEPMLAIDMHKRATARDLRDHPWLQVTKADGVVTDW